MEENESKKSKFQEERFEEVINKLYVIHEMRWNLGDIFAEVKEIEDYFLANEILSEIERKLWKYIMGKGEKN